MGYMNTPEITTEIYVNLRAEYALNNNFAPDTKIALLEHDSYILLLDLLTPAQRAQLLEFAQNGQFNALAGYVDYNPTDYDYLY